MGGVPRGQKEVGEKPKELQGIESRLRQSDSASHAPIQDEGCLVRVLRKDPHDRRVSVLHCVAATRNSLFSTRVDSHQVVHGDGLCETSRTAQFLIVGFEQEAIRVELKK